MHQASNLVQVAHSVVDHAEAQTKSATYNSAMRDQFPYSPSSLKHWACQASGLKLETGFTQTSCTVTGTRAGLASMALRVSPSAAIFTWVTADINLVLVACSTSKILRIVRVYTDVVVILLFVREAPQCGYAEEAVVRQSVAGAQQRHAQKRTVCICHRCAYLTCTVMPCSAFRTRMLLSGTGVQQGEIH